MNKKKTLLCLILFVCICGIALDSYLVYTHIMYRKNEKFKSGTCAWMAPEGKDDPCKQVNTSKYSEFMGIPVAVFGTAFFAWIFLLTFFSLFKAELQKFLLGVSLLSSGINILGYAFLTFKSVTELHHLCPLCITSATVMTFVFLLTVLYIRSLSRPLEHSAKGVRS